MLEPGCRVDRCRGFFKSMNLETVLNYFEERDVRWSYDIGNLGGSRLNG